MLTLLSQENSRQLRTFFEEAGYTEPNLRKYLGAPELPSRHLRNQPRLLDRTSAPTLLNALLRWFWLGIAQPEAQMVAVVPGEFLSLLLESGLIKTEDDSLVSIAMVLPIDGFLVASDHPIAIERQESELVLWPN